jgi:hypothetical protein
LHDVLHGTFAEGRFADHDGAMQILERPGHNLGAARTSFVDQNDERESRAVPSARPGSSNRAFANPPGLWSRRPWCWAGRNCPSTSTALLSKPPRIVAQVENERLHALFLQAIERLGELLRVGSLNCTIRT